MTDDTRDIEEALRQLRPRPLSPEFQASVARALAEPDASTRRNKIIPFLAWSTPVAAAAALALLLLPSGEVTPVGADAATALTGESAPELRLVRAEQAPSEVALLEPVKLEDGSFARPMRVRWSNAAQYRDVRRGAELIQYAPHDEIIGLVPMETY